MILFDTLSEKLVKINKSSEPIEFFVCGPTVYDKSHIGHARTYIVFDAFVKYLRSTGQKVNYLQNITDVDDKIIQRAKEIKTSPLTLSNKFEADYHKTEKALNITSVTKYAKASLHIKEIIKQIERLFAKDFAYETKNGVYFRVKKFIGYGKLSKQNLDDLRHGWRIDIDENKEDPLDFALWKKVITDKKIVSKKFPVIINGEPAWKSPWGFGRPGWHIEDTAITEKYFGPQYDIHGGGADLKFPHHESEIAQQEAVSGKSPLVKIWLHTGFLLVNGEKMSKSLHNFVTVDDFLKKYNANVLRLMILSNHFRSPFDFTDSLAQSANSSWNSIVGFFAKLEFVKRKIKKSEYSKINTIEHLNNFKSSLEDDFNTPKAMASFFGLINHVQPFIFSLSKPEISKIQNDLSLMLSILGFVVPKTTKIPAKIQQLVKKREDARKNKQFIQSDALREAINKLGYVVEDTPLGQFVWR